MKIYAGRAPFQALKGYIRDLRPMWLMEEVGVPYEIEYVDPREDVNKDWFLAMNPFGHVPVLKDGDFTLFESAAICTYMADKYKKFIPMPGTRERNLHDQWMMAAITNFEFNAGRVFACDKIFEQNEDTAKMRKNALENLESSLPGLERRLSKSEYLTGEHFMVCDLLCTSVLRYVHSTGYLEQGYPRLHAYLAKNMSRPGFIAADQKNGG